MKAKVLKKRAAGSKPLPTTTSPPSSPKVSKRKGAAAFSSPTSPMRPSSPKISRAKTGTTTKPRRVKSSAREPSLSGTDHFEIVTHVDRVGSRQSNEPDQANESTLPINRLPDLVLSIKETYRARQDLLVEEGSLIRRIRMIVARQLNLREFDEDGRVKKGFKVTDEQMQRLIPDWPKLWENKTFKTRDEDGQYLLFSQLVHLQPFLCSLIQIHQMKMMVEGLLEDLVEKLPVWDGYVKGILGISLVSLGNVIGEAGDLSIYSNPAKLWKRMGMAVIDGERQRKCLDKAKAEEHGYCPRRRATMFVIGDNIVKAGKGYLNELYYSRKERELEKAKEEGRKVLPSPQISALIKKGADKEGFRSEGHIHLRAKRYVEKRFLRDLWRAWRGHHQIDTHLGAASTPPRALKKAA